CGTRRSTSGGCRAREWRDHLSRGALGADPQRAPKETRGARQRGARGAACEAPVGQFFSSGAFGSWGGEQIGGWVCPGFPTRLINSGTFTATYSYSSSAESCPSLSWSALR